MCNDFLYNLVLEQSQAHSTWQDQGGRTSPPLSTRAVVVILLPAVLVEFSYISAETCFCPPSPLASPIYK